MKKVLIGTKKGMTQVFDEAGNVVPVTIIDISESYFISKDDNSVELGIGSKKHPTQAEQGKYKVLKAVPSKVKVFKLEDASIYGEYKAGDSLKPSIFEKGEFSQVSAVSKGKGFAGGVKRWGFAGGPKTHGQSDRHRAIGSIGSGTTPGRVYKGKKMPGRMGTDLTSILNVKIIDFDEEQGYILVKGGVPGSNGSLVVIQDSDRK